MALAGAQGLATVLPSSPSTTGPGISGWAYGVFGGIVVAGLGSLLARAPTKLTQSRKRDGKVDELVEMIPDLRKDHATMNEVREILPELKDMVRMWKGDPVAGEKPLRAVLKDLTDGQAAVHRVLGLSGQAPGAPDTLTRILGLLEGKANKP